jgi:1,4-dihydroxy-2-naphthoate octaprenyltransferase
MRASVWIDAARPKTLGATVAPVMIGAALAYRAGHLEVLWTVVALLSALCIQIGTNFCNDYCDYKKGADAQRVGPVRATQAGLVTPEQMKRATQVMFLLAILLGALLVFRGGVPILVIGIVSVVFGALYTAGPYPLAYIGLGDLFVLVFFGLVAVAGTYYVNALEWSRESFVFGVIPGLISVGILVVNNLRDYHSDLAVGKRTLVVIFGPRFGRLEYALCVLMPALISMCSANVLGAGGALIGAAAIVLWGTSLARSVWNKSGAELGALLPATNSMLLATSLLISLFVVFPL